MMQCLDIVRRSANAFESRPARAHLHLARHIAKPLIKYNKVTEHNDTTQ